MSSPFEVVKDGIIDVIKNNSTLRNSTRADWRNFHVMRHIDPLGLANEGRMPYIGVQANTTTLAGRRGTNREVVTTYQIRGYFNETEPKDRETWEDDLTDFAWNVVTALAGSEGFSFSFTGAGLTNHYLTSMTFDTKSQPIIYFDLLYVVEWYYDQDAVA